MITHPLYILAVLCLIVVASEWLVRRTALRHLGAALLVILVTAVAANLGVLPAGSSEAAPVPVYDGIFAYLAPLSIFWLLLRVNLRDLLQAGGPILLIFVIGSLATVVGVVIGMWVVDGPETLGPAFAAMGGMFAATYTGGSVNFNALALNYGVVREATLYGGAIVVDNVITTLWMVATLALPRLLAPLWPRRAVQAAERERTPPETLLGVKEDTETLHPLDLGAILALGLGALWLSDLLMAWLGSLGVGVPSIIILTVIALVLAQVPFIARAPGAQLLGMFTVYLFLAVIGAFCDLAALAGLGQLGLTLFWLALITVAVHGLLTFTAARLLKIDPDVAAVTSQANVGGAASALALARSIGRDDLVLPAVLVGSLGTALGTFLGFWAAGYLLPLLG